MASEERAYTLTDRGTFLAQRSGLDLAILSEGDPLLENPYSVIVISSAKHPSVNMEAARTFAQFLRSPAVQKTIAAFGVDKFGQPLFFPNRNHSEKKRSPSCSRGKIGRESRTAVWRRSCEARSPRRLLRTSKREQVFNASGDFSIDGKSARNPAPTAA
jgi:hypothetical protein